MNRWHFSAAVAALSVSILGAQSTPHTKRTPAAAHSALTCEDVIKLTKAGLAEDIIIEQIRKSGHAFDLTTDQLLALKSANVSDRIVEIMLDPAKALSPEKTPAVASAVPPLAPIEVIRPAPETEPRRAPIELPSEVGVYVKQDGQWKEVPPEIVYWKTGGVLKTVATAGIHHGDVNGHLTGAESRTRLEGPLEFLIVAPEGTALSEYQLVRLRSNKDNREFRTVTGGFFHAQSGAQRDVVEFDGEKVASRTFEIKFPSGTGSGEYGFLPPGSANGSGKIYSFRAVE